MTTTDFFDLAVGLAREQAKQVLRCDCCGSPLDADGLCPLMREQAGALACPMCPWCAKIGGHEPYCSVFDDPLTNYETEACPDCKGRRLHVEGCSNVEREVKFIRREQC